jgi:hypothetical protein
LAAQRLAELADALLWRGKGEIEGAELALGPAAPMPKSNRPSDHVDLGGHLDLQAALR